MADLGKQSEFSPEELDRLEDALERWTSADLDPLSKDLSTGLSSGPEDSSLAPHLRARLEDYRSLLAMTRDELPMEDVPDGLLASVLAEAHASAQPRTRPVTRRELAPAGPGLWERLRRSMLLPGFALAGSAALLLWVVQPSSDATLGDDEVLLERTAQTPAQLSRPLDASPAPAAAEAPRLEQNRLAAPELDAAADDKADAQAPAEAAGGSPATAPADAPGSPDSLDPLAEAELKDLAKSDRVPTKKTSKKVLAEPIETYPGLDDVPMAEGVDKEALRDTIDKADGARRKGGCTEAMSLYLEAMHMSGANSERARARAGYGLCLSSQGRDDTADKYFDAARALSPAIDAWIKRERGDGPSRKAPAKPSAKAKMEAPLD
ncbi:MAG TPA: hypothetical protein VGB85_03900 [Nannocystis sp.]